MAKHKIDFKQYKIRFRNRIKISYKQLEELYDIISGLDDEDYVEHHNMQLNIYDYEISGFYGTYILNVNHGWKLLQIFDIYDVKEGMDLFEVIDD